MKLTINPSFRDLIPALSKDEYKELENSLKKDGCLDALKIWNDTIIDGHNRYDICIKNKIDFEVTEMDFDGEDDAKIWIIKNQFGRRNISKATRAMLALELEPLIRERARENQLSGLKQGPVQQNSVKREPPISTQKEVAKIAGISHATIYEAKKVKESDNQEAREKMLTGEWSIHKAYTEVVPEKQDSTKTKVCTLCGIEKPLNEFSIGCSRCKECHSFTKKHGAEVASTIKRFEVADPDAVLLDMATKNGVDHVNSDFVATNIITNLLDILKSFHRDVNDFVYMTKELSSVGTDSDLYYELLKTERDILSIKETIKGGSHEYNL